MPHRRKREKGSFGGHFDELVEHFPGEQPPRANDLGNDGSKDDRNIHDRLFEGAWHEGGAMHPHAR